MQLRSAIRPGVEIWGHVKMPQGSMAVWRSAAGNYTTDTNRALTGCFESEGAHERHQHGAEKNDLVESILFAILMARLISPDPVWYFPATHHVQLVS